ARRRIKPAKIKAAGRKIRRAAPISIGNLVDVAGASPCIGEQWSRPVGSWVGNLVRPPFTFRYTWLPYLRIGFLDPNPGVRGCVSFKVDLMEIGHAVGGAKSSQRQHQQ